jgi:hypothetical protein
MPDENRMGPSMFTSGIRADWPAGPLRGPAIER